MHLYNNIGSKSDDSNSPAYVPSIFNFTPEHALRRVELSQKRYESMKRREVANMQAAQMQGENDSVGSTSTSGTTQAKA